MATVESPGGGDVLRKEEPSPCSPVTPQLTSRSDEEIRAVARKFAEQTLQNPEPGVWAVLTAISKNARQRPQGMNILLSGDEHCIGRCVDTRFQIGALSISASHCKILRDRDPTIEHEVDPNVSIAGFLKDTSTNGTYVNGKKVKKNSAKFRLHHGDIISFVAPPHDDKSYAFVYREVSKSGCLTSDSNLKRKSDDFVTESKRFKGIGIGAPEGPISLDDVRSLQRSNTELRQQVESHVNTIETLHSEGRATFAHHENEIKEMKAAVSNSYLDQIKGLKLELEVKQKELDQLNVLSSELTHSIMDLNERLGASLQSRTDADEVINSQKASISELEKQLDDERCQRRDERETAATDLKTALQRAHLEAQEEAKRQADAYKRQQREQLDVITKLQESEKESRLLVETLRSKLEESRENLIISEQKVRLLEADINEERSISVNSRKKSEALELELKRLRNEHESEKVAREEAWAKVSALELEIAAAIRDLSMEKQRYQGARERIILRETQLRAFYSTTEEISILFAKQQEQLKAMQKTLEDENNYETTSIGIDENEAMNRNADAPLAYVREVCPGNGAKEASGGFTSNNAEATNSCSGEDATDTQKHDCDFRNYEGNTQDLEYASVDRSVKGFGSDINGICTALVPDEDIDDTEQVLGTESQARDIGINEPINLSLKSSNLAVNMMQLDNEAHIEQKSEETDCKVRTKDAQTATITTVDLLASEGVGSWAVNTESSVHGENETPCMGDGIGDDVTADASILLHYSQGEASACQGNAVYKSTELTEDQEALNDMIKIVAPDFRQQFQGGRDRVSSGSASVSDTETDDGSKGGGASDTDDGAADEADEDNDCGRENIMIEDSVG